MAVDARLSVVDAHEVAVAAEHRLLHEVPHLASVVLHTDPYPPDAHHTALAHHGRLAEAEAPG